MASGPTPVSSSAPAKEAQRKHVKFMQWLNAFMWHWRNRPGNFDESNYPNWMQMPVPWRERGRDKSSRSFKLASKGTSWAAGGIREIRHGGSASVVDLDLSSAAYNLPVGAGAVWNRLQEVQAFFESSRAPTVTPGRGTAWVYQRALGYGGAGIACHYRIQETPERYRDVAIKVSILGWRSEELKRERQMMQKLSHASHIVQEVPRDPIGRPARQKIPLDWKIDDSSDEYDSSGDEDVRAELSRKMARWDPHPETPEMAPSPTKGGGDNTSQDDNGNNGLDDYSMDDYDMDDYGMDDYDGENYNIDEDSTDDGEKDYIVLEFARSGDLKNMIAKLHAAGNKIPQRVLWSWWICLFITGTQYGDADHSLVPRLKLADFGLAVEVKDQKRDCYYTNLRYRGKLYYYLPEQFGEEWESIAADRNGAQLCEEPVAGNFGSHSNIYQIALTMMCIITGCYPAQPPLAGTMKLKDGVTEIRSYGTLLLQGVFDWADAELRDMVVRCLAHDPAHRPELGELLQHATDNLARVSAAGASETDDEIRAWHRYEVLGAPVVDDPPQADSDLFYYSWGANDPEKTFEQRRWSGPSGV
ncbi:hypothetical protein SLS62_001030 [Diatrype stigma]|uniref:non-specific serine/threonine protein kinase n=1 Tax=Diatrype stigma TaxID=117547 RepID=A0AAN9UWV3_9PEZI